MKNTKTQKPKSPGRPTTVHVDRETVVKAIIEGLSQVIDELTPPDTFTPPELTDARNGWLRRHRIPGYPVKTYPRRKWCGVIRQMKSDGLLRADGAAIQLTQAGRELAVEILGDEDELA